MERKSEMKHADEAHHKGAHGPVRPVSELTYTLSSTKKSLSAESTTLLPSTSGLHRLIRLFRLVSWGSKLLSVSILKRMNEVLCG